MAGASMARLRGARCGLLRIGFLHRRTSDMCVGKRWETVEKERQVGFRGGEEKEEEEEGARAQRRAVLDWYGEQRRIVPPSLRE